MKTRLVRTNGFTFLELMLVLIILALVSTLAIQTLSGQSDEQLSKQTALRFIEVFQWARDEALLTQQAHGVILSEDSYSFARFDVERQIWRHITQDRILGAMPLDRRIRLELDTPQAKQAEKSSANLTPDIVVTTEGSLKPFVLTVYCDDVPMVKIHQLPSGELAQQAIAREGLL